MKYLVKLLGGLLLVTGVSELPNQYPFSNIEYNSNPRKDCKIEITYLNKVESVSLYPYRNDCKVFVPDSINNNGTTFGIIVSAIVK